LSRWRWGNKKVFATSVQPRRLHQGKKNRRPQRLAIGSAGDSVNFFGSLSY
jgi:hypothetical protein